MKKPTPDKTYGMPQRAKDARARALGSTHPGDPPVLAVTAATTGELNLGTAPRAHTSH